MATTVEYVIKLNDKFSSPLKNADKQVARFDKKMTGLGKTFSGLKSKFVGLFAAIGVAKVGGAILQATKDVEKFRAVLTNTFQSAQKAEESMSMIRDIAAKTPFEIDGLTASYIKLVNRGFKPTRNEIISLGDLASSQGKSFDQLTEAVLDAETLEFERLKEFGIKAKKSGKDVTFTFKGIKTTVAATDKEIRKYIIGLGKAQGITGSMAAISNTLGGRLSNLQDVLTQTAITIGEGISEPLKGGINKLIGYIQKLQPILLKAFKQWQPKIKAFMNQVYIAIDAFIENFDLVKNAFYSVYAPIRDLFETLGDLSEMFGITATTGGTVKTLLKVLRFTTWLATAPFRALIKAFKTIVQLFKIIIAKIKEWRDTTPLFKSATNAIKKALDFIIQPVKNLYGWFSKLVQKIQEYLGFSNQLKRRTGGIKAKKAGAGTVATDDTGFGGVTGITGGTKAAKGKGLDSRTVSGAAPKIININVSKFFDEMNINTTNISESYEQVKNNLLLAFQKMLADVQPVTN